MNVGHHTPHRDSQDDSPDGPRIGSLFTGYGGLDLAVHAVLGGHLAWYAEVDRHAQTVLAHRFGGVVNLGDIRAVDWTQVAPVDVVTAGFPCQDILAWPARTGGCGAADAAGRRRRTRRDRPGEQSGGSASGEPHRRRHPADHPARGPGAGAGLVGVAAA